LIDIGHNTKQLSALICLINMTTYKHFQETNIMNAVLLHLDLFLWEIFIYKEKQYMYTGTIVQW